jgi:hypothetical protein
MRDHGTLRGTIKRTLHRAKEAKLLHFTRAPVHDAVRDARHLVNGRTLETSTLESCRKRFA